MESLTKRIIAIVVIAGLIAGGGVGAWFFLSAPGKAGWETPGVSGIPEDRWIKVGYLGGLKGIQGSGGWQGTWLAAYDINTKDGGVWVNGTRYYVAVKARDTNEHDPQLPISTGLAAAENLIYVDEARYLMGGFRTEVTRAFLEIIMDNKLMFFGAGAATDEFANNVGSNYDRYKYYFRVTPFSSTKLAMEIVYTLCHIINEMETQLGRRVNKVAIVREGLSWTLGMSGLINGLASYVNYTVVEEIAYDIANPDFATYWSQIETAGAQIVIPIISGDTGINMMKQYGITHPQALVFGIDVEGQMTTYWDTTGGACNYEVFMTTLPPDCNVSEYSLEFYDDYVDRFGIGPTIYTAPGSYGGVHVLTWAINASASFEELDIIAQLETLTRSAGYLDHIINATRQVGSQRFAFTSNHDLEEGWPYGTTRWAQWQNGSMFTMGTGEGTYYTWGVGPTPYGDFSNLPLGIYPDWLKRAELVLPPWGIN